jgi:putative flippase GtrA
MKAHFIRYGSVSGLSLLTHNAVMIGADAVGAHLIIAVIASYCVVVVLGYILHCRITFVSTITWSGFGRYAAAMLMNIPLAFVTTGFWQHWIGLPMMLAAPLSTAMMVVFNYFASRWATSPRPIKDIV